MSKFFTWTKGDRLNAAEMLRSGKVVPIPIECISIKGFDYARNERNSSKALEKPPPLALHGLYPSTPQNNGRTQDSLELHDAALRSATTLMTVMNDVLRSPQLSAHLNATQTQGDGFTANQGRPRAHTMPSTPVFELPTPDPVELPGSMPGDAKEPTYTPQLCKSTTFPPVSSTLVKPPEQLRPDSSKVNQGCSRYFGPTASEDYTKRPNRQQALLSSSLLPMHRTTPSRDKDEKTLLGGVGDGSMTSSTTQPLNSVRRAAPIRSPPASAPLPTLTSGGNKAASSFERQNDTKPILESNLLRRDPETVFNEYLSSLRESQESYVQSLKEGHRKEVETYKAHIEFLERRNKSTDTHQHDNSGPKLSLEAPRLDVTTNANICADGGTEPTTREKALRIAITTLESRLVAANNERIDVLEGFNKACEEVYVLSQREKVLSQQIDALRSPKSILGGPAASLTPPSSEKKVSTYPRHKRTYSDVGSGSDTAHPLLQQIRSLRQIISEKDARIRQLEAAQRVQRSTSAPQTSAIPNTQSDQTSTSTEDLEAQKQLLASAQADVERYKSLLHSEIRRQAHSAVDPTYASAAEIEAHTSAIMAEKKGHLRAKASRSVANTSEADAKPLLQAQSMISLLEKELYHCINKVILCKLDVKAYRMELKKAQSMSKGLETNFSLSPPAKTTEPVSTEPSNFNPGPLQRKDSGMTEGSVASTVTIKAGLGVSVLDMNGRAKSVRRPSRANTTAASTPPLRPAASSKSPPPPPMTPPSTDKKLPALPLSTADSCQSDAAARGTLQRFDGFRSISDSVVPSYRTERATPPTDASPTPYKLASFGPFSALDLTLSPTPAVQSNTP